MKEALHIPAITGLSSVDATAIRQITLSLIEAIEDIKKDVETLKSRPQTREYKNQRNSNGI
jgi:hypothetical protein